ncbi:uncharacterized protein LOC118755110 [Rhagoletis pomonella]|nr:uncharacterized protein LOC118755110 [Rhagoletis pomonella]
MILPSITSHQPANHINFDSWKFPRNITLADSTFHKPGGIDCLIGAGMFFDLLLVGQIKLPNTSSVLQKTKLGWIVSGIAPPLSSSSPSSLHTASSLPFSLYKSFIAVSNHPQLDHLLEKFWTLESYNESSRFLSAEERACEKFFEATTTRCPVTNKFIVRLPLKEDPQTLGHSYETALKRLLGLEYKFARNPSLLKQYSEFMGEYESMKHMTELESNTKGR